MSFIYPLGLIGLIGVPLLIIIYIIKTKHTEQIIPSTYLWTLSEQFLKRKKQKKFVSGLVSLILQILVVITVSLLIAHPVITLKNKAKDYCFIIDASGSMEMIEDGTSKIELGKSEIEEIILESKDGSSYTLVAAGYEARIIYENLENKEKAIELLNKVETTGTTVNFSGIVKYVQERFNENKSLVTYLVTDRDYTSSNIEVINVSKTSENFAISSVEYVVEGHSLKVISNIISYASDTSLTLEYYINDSLVKESTFDAQKGVTKEVVETLSQTDFNTLKVVIKNKDGQILDNSYLVYNIEKSTEYNTLIVSDNPFYLYSSIKSVGNTRITMVKPENYSTDTSGYDLYVFDSFTPSVLPSDGTIWLFGVTESIEGVGFSVQDVIENTDGIKLTYPKNSTTTYKTLTAGLEKSDIYVAKYAKYGLYRNFTTLITCEGSPVVFTGLADNGCREVVFAFDLHNSNFALLMDYLVLTKNLLDYSFPSVLTDSTYVSGDTALINVIPGVDSIKITSPKGIVTYVDINKESYDLVLKETGVYTITITSGDDVKDYLVYSSMPVEESKTNYESVELSLQGEVENEFKDGKYDKLIVLFVVLALVFMIDWVVYCYDQYQLR